MRHVISHSRFPRQLKEVEYAVKNSRSNNLRESVASYVLLMLGTWSANSMEKEVAHVESIITVRERVRQCRRDECLLRSLLFLSMALICSCSAPLLVSLFISAHLRLCFSLYHNLYLFVPLHAPLFSPLSLIQRREYDICFHPCLVCRLAALPFSCCCETRRALRVPTQGHASGFFGSIGQSERNESWRYGRA